MIQRKWLCLILCLLLLGLAGCDGQPGEEGPTATPVPTMPPEPEPTIEPTETPAPTPEPAENPPEGGDNPAPEEGTVPEGGGLPEGGDLPAEGEGVTPQDPGTVMLAANQVLITPGPDETPILLDPIDKPTPEPAVDLYSNYTNSVLGISFDVPMLWELYMPSDQGMKFYEPMEDAKNGYPAVLTIQAYSRGSDQNAEDAKSLLLEIVNDLKVGDEEWEGFVSNDTASTNMAGAKGHYAYFTAMFNGQKLRGRIMVVAHKTNLYQVRISSHADYYTSYEEIYRRVRSSWKFL